MSLFVQASPEPLLEVAGQLRTEFASPVGRKAMEAFTSRHERLRMNGDEVPSVLPLFFVARRHRGSDLIEQAGKGGRWPFEMTADEQRTIEARSFGYIGIRGFPLDGPERGLFTYEFRRLLNLMPAGGLILDVRDNPGGSTNNAEESLQFLTAKTIAPLPFRFLASETTRKLTSEQREYQDYRASIDAALATGAAFSAGSPITAPQHANDLGQSYFGPVVLVTNAATYSAGDIFAAGFEDNGVGPILGIDETTGAGGANCWFYETGIRRMLGRLAPLPAGIDMQIAVRQCVRVGKDNLGVPIEEIGVPTSEKLRYSLTREDVVGQDRKPWALLLRAAKELAAFETCDLQVHYTGTKPKDGGHKREVSVETRGIQRLDFYVNGRPTAVDVEQRAHHGADVPPSESKFVFDVVSGRRVDFQIRGYADRNGSHELVARYVRTFHG